MGDYTYSGMDKVIQMYLNCAKEGGYDEGTLDMLNKLLPIYKAQEDQRIEDELDSTVVEYNPLPKIPKEKDSVRMVVAKCINNIGIDDRFELDVEYYCNPNPKGLGKKGIIDVQDMFGNFMLLEKFRFEIKE